MPFFQAATNGAGTGERASGDTTWEKVDNATLEKIWEWMAVAKSNDKVKRTLAKDRRRRAPRQRGRQRRPTTTTKATRRRKRDRS